MEKILVNATVKYGRTMDMRWWRQRMTQVAEMGTARSYEDWNESETYEWKY